MPHLDLYVEPSALSHSAMPWLRQSCNTFRAAADLLHDALDGAVCRFEPSLVLPPHPTPSGARANARTHTHTHTGNIYPNTSPRIESLMHCTMFYHHI
jgi:hypothetical protein